MQLQRQRRDTSNQSFLLYTLSSFADFDKFGIWAWQGVLFSRHGSLSTTCRVLVDNSNIKELASILHVRVSDLLRIQSEKQLIMKSWGKNMFIITAPSLYISQREARRSIICLGKGQKGALPKKDTVIAILVDHLCAWQGASQVEGKQQTTASLRAKKNCLQIRLALFVRESDAYHLGLANCRMFIAVPDPCTLPIMAKGMMHVKKLPVKKGSNILIPAWCKLA